MFETFKLNYKKKVLFEIFFVFLIFAIDRASKSIILHLSKITGEFQISLTSYLNLSLIWNRGIAFGLFSFEANLYYNLISFLIGAIILLIIIISKKSKGVEKISFLMIIGGALGNLFDRFYYKSVIDFIDFSFQNFHWFIFNVSDIFISLGVIILILLEFKKKNE
jgi:signal peptidase II